MDNIHESIDPDKGYNTAQNCISKIGKSNLPENHCPADLLM